MENYPHKNSKNQDSVIRLVAHPRAEESLYRCAAEGEKQHPKSLRERERERDHYSAFPAFISLLQKEKWSCRSFVQFSGRTTNGDRLKSGEEGTEGKLQILESEMILGASTNDAYNFLGRYSVLPPSP